VLVHIEVQGQPERDFARRMFVYYYRIFDRYERPIMSVAILADEQADWRERDEDLAASANPFAVMVRAYLAA
jgi:hypothetical protein